MVERTPASPLYEPISVALLLITLFLVGSILLPPTPRGTSPQFAAVITASNPFVYTFNSPGILYEAGSPGESTSPYWWLNSGAKLVMKDSVGSTIQGDLPSLDLWRVRYALANPIDTDNGYHPQNIFRLVTKATTGSQRVEALFKIERDNWSTSPNRNASNGLLFMSRYIDGNNLYYAGLRVDGAAVIKKKYKGTYLTLAYKKIFSGTYTAGGQSNLLPHGEWIGLRVENIVNAEGNVTVRLFMKRNGETTWTRLVEAHDNGSVGGKPLTGNGSAGIRTDFMDVSFENFRMEVL